MINGIVVLEQHRGTLLEAYENWFNIKMEKERQAREKRVIKNWEKLVNGMMIRCHIRAQYGGGGSASSSSSKR